MSLFLKNIVRIKIVMKNLYKSHIKYLWTISVLILSMGFSQLAHANNMVNINTANAAQLSTLDLIGVKRAADIVNFREANGAFEFIEEITKVKGVGVKTLERNRARLTVSEEKPIETEAKPVEVIEANPAKKAEEIIPKKTQIPPSQ
jgi:competence protein ComEA